jgi:hypothetical protein
MNDMERQVIVNTTHIAMLMKMFWVIIIGIMGNLLATIYGHVRNGKIKNGQSGNIK